MKLSARTLQILKNFATINPSLLFKPGSGLTTISPLKTMQAKATVSETFDSEFAIYDLSRFIGVLSLFEDPELEIDDKFLSIVKDTHKVNYVYADKDLIVTTSKDIKMPACEISFKLTGATFSAVMKALNVLSLPEVAVIGENGQMYFAALNTKTPNGDVYRVQVGETEHTFKMVFRAENMKLLQDDYDVKISSKGLGHFKGSDVEYWIATEASSSFA